MRVLQIIPSLDRCGAEKQLVLLAAGLPRDQFDVHVCALTRGGPLEQPLREAGIPVTVIGKSWKLDPLAYRRLKRHIARLQPDLVHTWIFAANAYGRLAARAAGVKHILAGERCVDPWKQWHELAIDRRLARFTERIVTNSSGVRDFYVGQGLAADKFVIIPNGVAPFSPGPPAAREEVLAELALPADARLILAVNRLWPQKRVKDLIWAADLLKIVRPNAHLLIVGDGPQRWRLERFREQVEIQDCVHLLGQRDDVPRLLPHCDCLWLGSAYEGQSNAILEAMSAGLPVIATDIAGNRDLVVPEKTGYLVPIGDRAAFARWTKVLLDDPELARRLGEAGRQRVLTEFSVDQMVARHAALYRELAA
ncbi:MAG: glycosyltransferase [Candidatus Anammoximicrobium sp.]|nr:glycosyltransferase [Candidatus Anammoximicrobium sp.]